MAGPVVSSVLSAAKSYLGRMGPAHAASYALAGLGGFAVERAETPHGAHAASVGAWVLAAFAALAVFALVNVLAHRWATTAASARVTESGEWVDQVVTMLLQRASGEDRRGAGAARRLIALLGGTGVGSRAARFALDWYGAEAISSVAENLASVPQGTEPIGKRVQAAVRADLAQRRRTRGIVLASVVGVVVVGAITAAVR